MVHCCIKGCSNENSKDNCRVISFFRIPSIYDGPQQETRKLTAERRVLWLNRIGRNELQATGGVRVCSDHFVSGSPAELHDRRNVDWVPSQNLDLAFSVTCQSAHTSKTCDAATQYDPPPCEPLHVSNVMTNCDVGTQCDIIMTNVASTQCWIKHIQKSKGMQTEIGTKEVACHANFSTSAGSTLPGEGHILSSPSTQPYSSQGTDTTYKPGDSYELDSEEISSSEHHSFSTQKFIIYKECLAMLLQYCPECSLACAVSWRVVGSFVSVTQNCSCCDFTRKWSSQPMVKDIPAGNLHLSAAIYFSGASFSKMHKVFTALRLASISSSTFYRHVQLYLQPTILSMWNDHQQEILSTLVLRTGDVIIGGDMRADSPGHCAKYGCYTVMELRANRIIDISLVQSNEVGGSTQMEKAGLIRSLKLLQDHGVSIDTIVTDRHPQIQKYIRESVPSVRHFYDCWHVAKGMRKKLDAVANSKGCDDARSWIHSIVNHLYWSASTSCTSEETVAKWKSVANHIQNVHSHEDWQFPSCQHAPVDDNSLTKWLVPGTSACERIVKVVMNQRLLTDVAKLSPFHQTSSIEAFHSLILNFAPKTFAFSYLGMLSRLQLAALHYNENADREQAKNGAGKLQYAIRFPKYKKGEYTLTPVKTDPTYGYVDRLMGLLFSEVVINPDAFQLVRNDVAVPPTLCSAFVRPTPTEMANRQSRFRQKSEK